MLDRHNKCCYTDNGDIMELRVLEYFLAVAREQNITRAAEYLHITQPTLSRQITDLENELGKQLFIRGKRKVTLTEHGLFLRKKAEEIVTLAHRTETQMKNSDNNVSGDIYIGCGETDAMHNIAKTAKKIQEHYSDVHFHIISGDTVDLTERLDKGLFDFCLLIGAVDQSKYDYIALPYKDTWGVLMPNDSPLAYKNSITAEDLWDKPLILSRQTLEGSELIKWIKKKPDELYITATYNLAFNASIMAKEKMGYVITLDKLINTTDTDLCFRPLSPSQTVGMSMVWKKYQPQSKAAEIFIKKLSESIRY